MWLYAFTVFLGAFLLFLVQPIVAKQIVPWFGGSAAVWLTALAFFQTMLLAGYAYADLATRRLRARPRAMLHVALLVAALAFLPVIVDPGWKPAGDEDPSLRVLLLLAATVGLPFFLLSATAPLVQAWFAESFAGRRVYRLFALSNLAALIGFASYPFAIEPLVATATQARLWSAGFALFAVACAATALHALRHGSAQPSGAGEVRPAPTPAAEPPPAPVRRLTWFLLAGLGAFLLVATTSHITRDIASIPFLWVAPLALYLFSFVLCFEGDRWYRRGLVAPLAAGLLLLCAWGLQADAVTYNLPLLIVLYLAGLFVLCMFAHGELAADRPAPAHLTRFYLMVAAGGAAGGCLAGIAAPYLLPDDYELGFAYVAFALAAAFVLRRRDLRAASGAAVTAVLAAVFVAVHIDQRADGTRVLTRSFYGTVMTFDRPPDATGHIRRILVDGNIRHGEQYLDGPLRDRPIAYYGPGSGIGRVMALKQGRPLHVGVLGLGAGVMAAHGKAGDRFRFYEINPDMVEVATTEFGYLAESPAEIAVVLGDGRLSLEREAPNGFDVLMMDAFSSGSVPMHFLTVEAMGLYLRHLAPDGVIVFNVTNRYVDLVPPIRRIAAHHGLAAVQIRDLGNPPAFSYTNHVLVTRDPAVLAAPMIAEAARPWDDLPPGRAWTDDFNNLIGALFIRARIENRLRRLLDGS